MWRWHGESSKNRHWLPLATPWQFHDQSWALQLVPLVSSGNNKKNALHQTKTDCWPGCCLRAIQSWGHLGSPPTVTIEHCMTYGLLNRLHIVNMINPGNSECWRSRTLSKLKQLSIKIFLRTKSRQVLIDEISIHSSFKFPNPPYILKTFFKANSLFWIRIETYKKKYYVKLTLHGYLNPDFTIHHSIWLIVYISEYASLLSHRLFIMHNTNLRT